MRYVDPLFRPPSEAESLIFQVTVGCSHNACLFCGMYRNKRYYERPVGDLLEEIREAAAEYPWAARVFLADGDALAAPAELLMEALAGLKQNFGRLRRVSAYATPQNLIEKTPEELSKLRAAGLGLIYLGLESGSREVLKRQNKGVVPEQAAEAVKKAHSAGMKSSLMVLLGLGGTEGSEEHARSTAGLCNQIQPLYLSALTWMPVRQAPLWSLMERGDFNLPGDDGILAELEMLVRNLDLNDTVFRANHASNPLPIAGRLSRDRESILDIIGAARRGAVPLRPFFLRGT